MYTYTYETQRRELAFKIYCGKFKLTDRNRLSSKQQSNCEKIQRKEVCDVLQNPYESSYLTALPEPSQEAGNAGNVFYATDFKGNRELAFPACITSRASRTCPDACRDC